MDLTKKDVADLLNVSEITIMRLVDDERLPSYSLGGEIRFSRAEIEDWMLQHLQRDVEDLLPDTENRGWHQFGLFRAIHKGAVITNATSTTKEGLIKEVIDQVATQMDVDADVVAELLIDRENLMPTALNHGIAVPHTREFLLKQLHDVVVIVFPSKPIEWGALDAQPVHTLFFLFACDDKRHLNLLAKIAHISSSRETRAFLQTRPEKGELLDAVKRWEQSMVKGALVGTQT